MLLACTESKGSPDKAHEGFTLGQRGKWVLVCFVLVFLSENSPHCVSSPAYTGGWEACPQWLTADSLCVKSYRRWTLGLESEITGQAGVRGQAEQGWAEPLGAAQIDKFPGARLPFVYSPCSECLLPASRHRGWGWLAVCRQDSELKPPGRPGCSWSWHSWSGGKCDQWSRRPWVASSPPGRPGVSLPHWAACPALPDMRMGAGEGTRVQVQVCELVMGGW